MKRKIGIAMVCLLVTVLLLFVNPPALMQEKNIEQPVQYGAPQTPLRASLDLKPLPLVGKPAILTCTVSSTKDAPETQIEIELPPDARLLSGDLTWKGDIPAGQSVTLSAKISFIKLGDKALYCRALRRANTNHTWSDSAELYANIGQHKSMLGYAPVPPEKRNVVGKQIRAGNGLLISTETPLLRKATEIIPPPPPNPVPLTPHENSSLPTPSVSANACSTLTITGWVGYADRNGNAAPADEMLVEVINDSTGAHLQWCYVNDDGTYSCPNVPNPYPAAVRTVTRSWTNLNPNGDILTVVNPDIGTTNSYQNAFTIWSGATVFNTPAGCIGDIGGWWIDATGANRVAFWIESDLIRGWQYIFFGTGSSQSPQETTGPATVEWKSDSAVGNYYTHGGNIYLKGTAPQNSMTVVNHEYGHNVMYNIYGNYMPLSNCGSHDIPVESNSICAWVEGWATFFSSAVNNDPTYYYSGGGSIGLEAPTWSTIDWDEGDTVEGRVTGALWDILDPANEGTDIYLNGNIDEIWDTIYHQNDDTLAQYWAAWKSRGHQEPWVVMSIYQNTIDYRSSPPTNFNKSSPSNGATGQSSSPTLSWGSSSSIFAYCIDTSNNKTCNASWISTGSNTSVMLSNLSPSTTYYWQVRSSGTLSHTYANAPDTWWSFTTTSAPAAFNKSSPSNGATGQSLSPTISWGSTGATSYEYCYDTSNDNACSSWTSNGTSTSKALSGLSAGTTYYWHVRAKKSGFTTYSNGSSTAFWSFTTASAPGAFNKSSPSNGATGQSLSPTISWGSSSGATSYEYCYDTSNDNACSSWISNGTSTSKALSSLSAGTTYYWHVRAKNSNGTTYSNDSTTAFWSFATLPVPGAFNKSSPSNGVTGQLLSPTISWVSSGNATSYEYCYDTSNDNACSSWTSNGASTSKALSGLSAGTTYYWHVRAKNSNGTTYSNGSTTAFWSFTTGSPPAAFNKISPTDTATGQSLSPTISWNSSSGAISYEYCYDTSSNQTCDNPWVTANLNTSVRLSGLSLSTTYYWQVRAVNGIGTTLANGGSWWSFRTADTILDGDDFDNPFVIDALPYTTSLDTTSFTTAADDPNFQCGSYNQGWNSVWYTFTPTQNGTLTASTEYTNFDTVLAIWTGTRGSLTSVACNDDYGGIMYSRVDVPVQAGVQYFIEVAGYRSQTSPSPAQKWPGGEGGSSPDPVTATSGTLYLSVSLAADPIIQTLTVRSVGAYDGWILESTETSTKGGTMEKNATTFNLGDGVQDKQYRAILHFNTNNLPDNAVITKVTLKIKKQGLSGTNPFNILGGLKVDMRKPYFGPAIGLVVGDFQAAAGKSAVATFNATPVSNWYSALLNATGRAYVNKTGTTQFRLRFATDDNNDNGADYMKFYSGNYATASARPMLVIEYYIP